MAKTQQKVEWMDLRETGQVLSFRITAKKLVQLDYLVNKFSYETRAEVIRDALQKLYEDLAPRIRGNDGKFTHEVAP